MVPPSITQHAVYRYIERVAPVSAEVAISTMEAAFPAVAKAREFGCDCVVMGNGARLVLQGDVIVTVLPKRLGRRPQR